jgi:hypothetical protein
MIGVKYKTSTQPPANLPAGDLFFHSKIKGRLIYVKYLRMDDFADADIQNEMRRKHFAAESFSDK